MIGVRQDGCFLCLKVYLRVTCVSFRIPHQLDSTGWMTRCRGEQRPLQLRPPRLREERGLALRLRPAVADGVAGGGAISRGWEVPTFGGNSWTYFDSYTWVI